MKLRDLFTVIRMLPDAVVCYVEKRTDELQRDILAAKMMSLGYKWNIGNPAYDVGTALRMAEQYNIKLAAGTCYSDCRAILEREHWQAGIAPDLQSWVFGTFEHDKSHDEIESIYAFGRDVQTAICKCFINARMAGVI